MRVRFIVPALSIGAVAAWLALSTVVRGEAQRSTPSTERAAAGDWPLHNLDLSNSRYSPLAEIFTFALPDRVSPDR